MKKIGMIGRFGWPRPLRQNDQDPNPQATKSEVNALLIKLSATPSPVMAKKLMLV